MNKYPLIFPAASRKGHILSCVDPTLNVEPGECDLYLTRLPEVVQLSVAVGSVHETVAVHDPEELVRVIFSGQFDITGFSLSSTTTSKLQVSLLRAVSVAISSILVVPTLNVCKPGCPDPD